MSSAAIADMSETGDKPTRGIRCPRCNCAHLDVDYSQLVTEARRRIRYCRNCGRKIVTRETIENQDKKPSE